MEHELDESSKALGSAGASFRAAQCSLGEIYLPAGIHI